MAQICFAMNLLNTAKNASQNAGITIYIKLNSLLLFMKLFLYILAWGKRGGERWIKCHITGSHRKTNVPLKTDLYFF